MRPTRPNRWPFLLVVWGAATVLGLAVAAVTTIGPVLFSVSRNHGVHLGDVVVFVLVYGIALMVTGWTAARDRVR